MVSSMVTGNCRVCFSRFVQRSPRPIPINCEVEHTRALYPSAMLVIVYSSTCRTVMVEAAVNALVNLFDANDAAAETNCYWGYTVA